MRKQIIATILITLGVCFGQITPVSDNTSKKEAERIWELAIGAQGGREKLCSVRNVVVISRSKVRYGTSKVYDHVSESLFVLPYIWWNLDDNRPSVLGITMRMENYETKLNYIAHRGGMSADLRPMETGRLIGTLNENGNVTWFPDATFLLETKWWKPILESATTGKIGNQNVDIVQTTLYGRRTDYYFDQKSHLNIRRVVHAINVGDKNVTLYTTDLSDHVSVGGIVMPTKISYPGQSGVENLSFEINVDYNEEIFTKAPLPAETASGAWRKKKQ